MNKKQFFRLVHSKTITSNTTKEQENKGKTKKCVEGGLLGNGYDSYGLML